MKWLVVVGVSLASVLLPEMAQANPLRYQGESVYSDLNERIYIVSSADTFVSYQQRRTEYFRTDACGVLTLPTSQFILSNSQLGIEVNMTRPDFALPIVEAGSVTWSCGTVNGQRVLLPGSGPMPQFNSVLKVGTRFYWIPAPGGGSGSPNTLFTPTVLRSVTRRLSASPCGFVSLNGAEIRGARITINGGEETQIFNTPTVDHPPLCRSGIALVPQSWSGSSQLPTYNGATAYRDANNNVYLAGSGPMSVDVGGQVRNQLVRTDACGTFSIRSFTHPTNVAINGTSVTWPVQQSVTQTRSRWWECVNGQLQQVRAGGDNDGSVLPGPNRWIMVGGLLTAGSRNQYYGVSAPLANLAVRFTGTETRRVTPSCGLAVLRNSRTEPFDESTSFRRADESFIPLANLPQVAVAPQCRSGQLYLPTGWVY